LLAPIAVSPVICAPHGQSHRERRGASDSRNHTPPKADETENASMRNAIFSILAIVAIALGITATGAMAKNTYLFPPCNCNDGNG